MILKHQKYINLFSKIFLKRNAKQGNSMNQKIEIDIYY